MLQGRMYEIQSYLNVPKHREEDVFGGAVLEEGGKDDQFEDCV